MFFDLHPDNNFYLFICFLFVCLFVYSCIHLLIIYLIVQSRLFYAFVAHLNIIDVTSAKFPAFSVHSGRVRTQVPRRRLRRTSVQVLDIASV